jgi:hypothetical protein
LPRSRPPFVRLRGKATHNKDHQILKVYFASAEFLSNPTNFGSQRGVDVRIVASAKENSLTISPLLHYRKFLRAARDAVVATGS